MFCFFLPSYSSLSLSVSLATSLVLHVSLGISKNDLNAASLYYLLEHALRQCRRRIRSHDSPAAAQATAPCRCATLLIQFEVCRHTLIRNSATQAVAIAECVFELQ